MRGKISLPLSARLFAKSAMSHLATDLLNKRGGSKRNGRQVGTVRHFDAAAGLLIERKTSSDPTKTVTRMIVTLREFRFGLALEFQPGPSEFISDLADASIGYLEFPSDVARAVSLR